MSKTEIHGGMLYSNIGKGQDQTANTGPDFKLQFQWWCSTSFLLHNLLQDTWILNLSILQPTFDEKAGFSFAFLKTNLYWLYQMKNKKTTKPNQTQTKKNPNQNQTKKTPKKPKPQVAQFWSTSPKSCFQGQVKNWVMRMPGGFAIKLLLLLQAKQSTCRSCSLLVLYGYFSQPFSSHPEEISGTITLVITNTHQPQCPTPTKSAADRAGTLRIWILLVPYTIITNCALHCLAQALAPPKETHPEGWVMPRSLCFICRVKGSSQRRQATNSQRGSSDTERNL